MNIYFLLVRRKSGTYMIDSKSDKHIIAVRIIITRHKVSEHRYTSYRWLLNPLGLHSIMGSVPIDFLNVVRLSQAMGLPIINTCYN